jgi:hypothetical protein
MILNINYQIWFKCCRSIRIKYKLSSNCVLVLNGVYVYSKVINQRFTRRKILDFVSYYNIKKIDCYLTVLISKGYVIQSGQRKTLLLYSISPIGLTVINELNQSYQDQFNIFVSKYNIVL